MSPTNLYIRNVHYSKFLDPLPIKDAYKSLLGGCVVKDSTSSDLV